MPSVGEIWPRPYFRRVIIVEDSSMVSSLKYDRKAQILEAIFRRDGSRYQYKLGPDKFIDLITSVSIGRAFHKLILKPKRRDGTPKIPYRKMRNRPRSPF